MMLSINRQGLEIADQMVAESQRLGISVTSLKGGARLIDIGLDAPGGWLAGKYAAEISLGGLGDVSFMPLNFSAGYPSGSDEEFWLPGVRVVVDQPVIACMASQYAGWGIRREGYFAIGSGPARAASAVEPLFQKLPYKDNSDSAVIILEGNERPTDEAVEYIARKCRIDPARLTILAAPAACLAGSFQLSARVVATGMHKMLYLGFDVTKVLHGYGTCPIAPVVTDEDLASALSNDCVLYGGRVHYTVRADDDELEALVKRIPSSASESYGTPFYQLYQKYGSFYNMDPLLFCTSEVSINNLNSGHTYRSGQPHLQVLRTSLLGEQLN
jgi:methenyltetrahydromethanopterin cyclohydrolase